MSSATQIIRRRRNRQQRRAAVQAQARAWSYFIIVVFAILVVLPLTVFFGTAAVVYAQEVATLPVPRDTIDISAVAGPTRLYDRSGQTLIFTVADPLGDQRTWTTLDQLPPYVVQATLLVEDSDFMTATRFDPLLTSTRLWRNFISGPSEPDGSITARLVRNAIAPPPEFVRPEDRTREIALTAEINRLYSPQQILEWHLNTNYYGNEAYGIESAARVYLGKSAGDLTVDEAALLTSISTAPQFNPIDNEVAARGRQADTLRRMLLEGVITQEQYDTAVRSVTVLLPDAGQRPDIAPEFALYARKQAEIILDSLGLDGGRLVSRGGLRIVTTLDLGLYYQTECVLRSHLAQLNGSQATVTAGDGSACETAFYLGASPPAGDLPPDQGVITILDVETGEIRALVGNAARADYQPGATLYPFVYFEGFRGSSQGVYYTPASMVLDVPRTYTGQVEGLIYQPTNSGSVYRGPISVREAAGRLLLTPTIEVANTLGLSSILRTAHSLGINSLNNGVYHLSLLEDAGEVAPLDVAYAYSVLASLGDMHGIPVTPRDSGYRTVDPVAVLRIEDQDGRLLWEYDAASSRLNLFSDYPELGYLVNSVLSNDELKRQQFGADNPLTLDRPAAVVNGLTTDRVDNWTAGYTPQMVVVVRLGRSDLAGMSLSGTALTGAAPLWKAVIQYAHLRNGIPPTEWQRPMNIVDVEVCQRSGLLPNGVCPTYRESFINGITPTQQDTYWRSVEINSRTVQLATENTPDALRETRAYFIPPDSALDWWKANRQELPPTESDVAFRSPDDLFGATVITSPEAYAYVKGVVEVRGNVNTDNLQYFKLAYGKDVNPSQWVTIGEDQTTFDPETPLALWDTAGLDGFYTLELTTVLQSGVPERDTLQVRVDNSPPTIILSTSEPGKIYRFPEDRVVKITADVRDNFIVDRVEFYHDGLLVSTDTEFPFEYDYGIPGTGIEFFRAEAYDAAGNLSSSEEIQVEVRR